MNAALSSAPGALRILHGADFHLDSPFSGLTPEQAVLRRSEQRLLLKRLAEAARTEEPHLILLCGDLFDSRRIFRETAQTLAQALGEISCPVFIAPGNHDFYAPDSPYAALSWPENVHIFRSSRMESIPLPQLGCTVHGAAFTSPVRDSSPLSGFSAPQDGMLHIMALHGEMEGTGPYAPISKDEAAASGLHYLALGHIHKASGLQWSGGTAWAYPGCPEGRGFDETGEKGVSFVELSPHGISSRFFPLQSRKYERLDVDLTGTQSAQQTTLAALPPNTDSDIYRIRLTGQCPAELVQLTALHRALSPRFFSLELQDHTQLPRELWRRAEEDNLTGLFLREVSRRLAAAPEDENLALALRFGLAALEHGEDIAP